MDRYRIKDHPTLTGVLCKVVCREQGEDGVVIVDVELLESRGAYNEGAIVPFYPYELERVKSEEV